MFRRSHLREKSEPIRVVAHRGSSAIAPENSIAAFRLAIDAGVDAIELDVHLSADDEVVVIHDRTLQRTTTGNGAVRSYAYDELRQFDAGSWFGSQFSSERIPRLSDVLLLARDRCAVNIELKSNIFDRSRGDSYESRVLEVVRSCSMTDNVLYSSFNHHHLSSIRRLEPKSRTGVLYRWYRDFLSSPTVIASQCSADIFICSRSELRRSMIVDAHRNGVAVYVYTVNDPKVARQLADMAVDGVISDDPTRILSRR